MLANRVTLRCLRKGKQYDRECFVCYSNAPVPQWLKFCLEALRIYSTSHWKSELETRNYTIFVYLVNGIYFPCELCSQCYRQVNMPACTANVDL